MAKRGRDWTADVRDLLARVGVSTTWVVGFVAEALADLDEIARSGQIDVILAALAKLAKDPRAKPDGYGEPLGNRQATGNLTGLLSVKLKGRLGLRIVYGLTKEPVDGKAADAIKVLVVQDREEEKVYREALKRLAKYKDLALTVDPRREVLKRRAAVR